MTKNSDTHVQKFLGLIVNEEDSPLLAQIWSASMWPDGLLLIWQVILVLAA